MGYLCRAVVGIAHLIDVEPILWITGMRLGRQQREHKMIELFSGNECLIKLMAIRIGKRAKVTVQRGIRSQFATRIYPSYKPCFVWNGQVNQCFNIMCSWKVLVGKNKKAFDCFRNAGCLLAMINACIQQWDWITS